MNILHILKSYFIHFNHSLYNTLNIKNSIILPLYVNILFLFFLYVFFMLSINYHVPVSYKVFFLQLPWMYLVLDAYEIREVKLG